MESLDNAILDLIHSCEKNGARPTRFALMVAVSDQTVSLFENVSSEPDQDRDHSRPATGQYRFIRKCPCSTSRFGVGQREGSNCTPLRLHRIAEKIGAGSPAGTVFKGRRAIGHVSQPELADAKITTRILWLEGLEPGFNRGGNVDSHARFIYIHGTADQSSIGKPASCGCIHLADNDLVPLFDLLPGGTLVWISQ
ncbi:MAG: L,D-transpeptidase family protein [Limisphaerales bacterium]